MLQFKLLVCDTQAQPGYFLVKWLLNSYKHGKIKAITTLYVKQTAIPLHAIQNIELLPD